MAPTSILNANGVEIGVIGNIADESAYISSVSYTHLICKQSGHKSGEKSNDRYRNGQR